MEWPQVLGRCEVRNAIGQFAGDSYVKIDGEWYRGRCESCDKPVKGIYAKQCHDCYWAPKLNPVRIGGKAIPHYHKAHYWIAKVKGKPGECENCGLKSENTRRFHWANISDEYLLDESDWLRLCVNCHKAFDRGKKHE